MNNHEARRKDLYDILAVDDDLVCLQFLISMLKKKPDIMSVLLPVENLLFVR